MAVAPPAQGRLHRLPGMLDLTLLVLLPGSLAFAATMDLLTMIPPTALPCSVNGLYSAAVFGGSG